MGGFRPAATASLSTLGGDTRQLHGYQLVTLTIGSPARSPIITQEEEAAKRAAWERHALAP